MSGEKSLADRMPYDPANGARVGIVVGALLGVAAALLTSFQSVWLYLGGSMVGGAVGYWTQKRELQRQAQSAAEEG